MNIRQGTAAISFAAGLLFGRFFESPKPDPGSNSTITLAATSAATNLLTPAHQESADRISEITDEPIEATLNSPQLPPRFDAKLAITIKPATAATRARQLEATAKLESFTESQKPLDDAQRGLIAPLKDGGLVRDVNGRTIWNLADKAVAKPNEPCPETVNPALWRQLQLLGIGGLFQVCDRIYQVRGLDLANITFIEGDSSLIVIDPLLSAETARQALELYYEHRPRKPVRSVIITHSHPDHFGGIFGIATKEQIADGTICVIAPSGFLDEVINENVLAGNTMQRRATYMYGSLLPKSPTGDIGTGLGLGTSTGTASIVKPTDYVSQPLETRTLDGLTFEFQLTPGSEAPAEMHLFIHELQALCTAENATQTMHNLYTLRGAKVRDAKAWSSYLQHSIDQYGARTDVLFAPHHWPVWGSDEIRHHLSQQRDLYKFIHDQTLRLANRGLNMLECAEQLKLPEELEQYWANRGFYGCLNQNVKAVWNYYLGWFDGNPARLHPLPPQASGAKYVECMGGIDQVVLLARQSYDAGEYRWVAQLLDHAVSAYPDHLESRQLLADTLEQLGYQAECGPWRNFYLTGAQELRQGVRPQETPTIDSAESIAAMPLRAVFETMAVRVNSESAANRNLIVSFHLTDTQEHHRLMLNNGILNHFPGRGEKEADCRVALSRPVFDEILDGRSTFIRQVLEGRARVTGSPRKLQLLFQPIEQFDLWYPVMPPQSPVDNSTAAK